MQRKSIMDTDKTVFSLTRKHLWHYLTVAYNHMTENNSEIILTFILLSTSNFTVKKVHMVNFF